MWVGSTFPNEMSWIGQAVEVTSNGMVRVYWLDNGISPVYTFGPLKFLRILSADEITFGLLKL